MLSINGATLPPLGADTWVHAQILAVVDRSTYDIHAACTAGPTAARTPTFSVLSKIPDLKIHTVRLGRERVASSKHKKIGVLVDLPLAVASIGGLIWYTFRHHIDMIHTTDRPRDAVAAIVIARTTRRKSIVHAHVAFGDWMGAPLRWSLRHADALVAVSAFVARSLVRSGHDPAKIHVVLNCIDPHAWRPGQGREAARHELGLPESSLVLLSVSRLFKEKGPGELLEAVALIRTEVPDLRVVITGSDTTPNGEFSEELRAIVKKHNLGDQVIFTGYRSDIARLMAAADIYAMPSFEEPFGLVYAEAMAMKLPVVALNSGGVPELIEHGVTGLLSEPGDRAALAANLLALLRDPDRCSRMGEAGRATIENRFTPADLARGIESVYQSMLQ